MTLQVRPAEAGDIEALVDLMNLSSAGALERVWGRIAGRPEAWRAVARKQLSDREGEVGYGRIVVVSKPDGPPLGMILLNPLEDTTTLPLEGLPAEAVPMVRLIRQASNTLLIREVAVVPEHRGEGIGAVLLALAVGLAKEKGLRAASLTVHADNQRALALYHREGFSEEARAASLGHPRYRDGSPILLMAKAEA